MLSQFHPISNQGCQCLPQCIVTNSSLVSFEGYKCLTCLWSGLAELVHCGRGGVWACELVDRGGGQRWGVGMQGGGTKGLERELGVGVGGGCVERVCGVLPLGL